MKIKRSVIITSYFGLLSVLVSAQNLPNYTLNTAIKYDYSTGENGEIQSETEYTYRDNGSLELESTISTSPDHPKFRVENSYNNVNLLTRYESAMMKDGEFVISSIRSKEYNAQNKLKYRKDSSRDISPSDPALYSEWVPSNVDTNYYDPTGVNIIRHAGYSFMNAAPLFKKHIVYQYEDSKITEELAAEIMFTQAGQDTMRMYKDNTFYNGLIDTIYHSERVLYTWKVSARRIREVNAAGDIVMVKEEEYDFDTETFKRLSKKNYTYDAAGNLLTIVLIGNEEFDYREETTYTYNDNNDILSFESRTYDNGEQDHSQYEKTTFIYDSDYQLVSKNIYQMDFDQSIFVLQKDSIVYSDLNDPILSLRYDFDFGEDELLFSHKVEREYADTIPYGRLILPFNLQESEYYYNHALLSETYSEYEDGNWSGRYRVEYGYDFTDIVSGVNQINDVKVNVYPNPASDYLNIEMDNNDTYQLSIYDVSGKLVRSEMFNQNMVLNVADLSDGVWFYRITSNSRLVKKDRFIVTH